MLFNQSSAKSLSPRKRRAISIGYKSISNPYFAAPETIEGNLDAITEKCDIWSCGVLMYLLLSGELPFKNDITTQSPSHDIPSRVSFEQLKETLVNNMKHSRFFFHWLLMKLGIYELQFE